MNFVGLISILSFVMSYTNVQYEAGSSNWSHFGNLDVPSRQIDVFIQFQNTFVITPELFLSAKHFDLNFTYTNGFIIKLVLQQRQVFYGNLLNIGFKLSAIAVSSSKLHELKADWFAFQDDKVSVITFESSNHQELITGSGNRIIIETINHKFKGASNGILSLIGYIHQTSEVVAEIKIEQITSSTINVSVQTYNTGLLEYVKFNILLGTDQSLWVWGLGLGLVDY